MFATKCTVESSGLEPLVASYKSLTSLKRFEANHGDIAELLCVDINPTLLRAALELYDPKVRGFVLKDVVLVPLVEEYRALLRLPEKGRHATVPRFAQLSPSGQLSKLLRVPKSILDRFDNTSGGYQGFDWDRLRVFLSSTKSVAEITRENFVALGIYAMVLFPSKKNFVDYDVLNAFGTKETALWDPIPAILAETFRALNRCAESKKGNLECCLQLLTIWLLTHLPLEVRSLNRFTPPCFTTAKPIKEFKEMSWPRRNARQWAEFLTTVDSDTLIMTPI